jgi:hypothetical protein
MIVVFMSGWLRPYVPTCRRSTAALSVIICPHVHAYEADEIRAEFGVVGYALAALIVH